MVEEGKLINILRKYWKYDSFRPSQYDIIRNILSKKDTLALLPTGGGKSICFQVPALAQNGLCLVVSPLIALMKDQVQSLTKKGINASALISGMNYRELDNTLENCRAGKIKLLYVSPERLQSDEMKERLKHLPISFIAVDEAHCISQWGYNFRPSYLKIAEFRKLLPEVPVLALTATATPKVVSDIMMKLEFDQPLVVRKSFARSNIAYKVFFEENKWNRMAKLFSGFSGSGIVYTRNRKLTKTIAEYLLKHGVSADYYHAGLSSELRDAKQRAWTMGTTQIIVATNAFGMGIDKPDVRMVLHLHVADNIESYFQEAGRAGRDEKSAEAITLFEQKDLIQLKQRVEQQFPEKTTIKAIYEALGSFFQLAVGSGLHETFEFDLNAFATRFNFKPLDAFNSLSILEKDGYLSLSDSVTILSRLKLTTSNYELYDFQLRNPNLDPLIKYLLRSYSGLFDHYTKIKERQIAHGLKSTEESIIKALKYLHQIKLVDYQPASSKPKLTWLKERIQKDSLRISTENYEKRKEDVAARIDAMVNFLQNDQICRSVQLLSYFGEENSKRCGVCDVCQSKEAYAPELIHQIDLQLKKETANEYRSALELIDIVKPQNEKAFMQHLNWLVDTGQMVKDEKMKLRWITD